MVAELNRMRAAAANQYLYAASKDDDAAAIAVKHRDDFAGFTIGAPGPRPNVKIKPVIRLKRLAISNTGQFARLGVNEMLYQLS